MASKTYYSVTPGSTYIDRKGVVHQFLGGQLTVSDPEVIAELDATVATGSTQLRASTQQMPDAASLKVAAEISKAAERTAALLAAQLEKEAVAKAATNTK